MCADLFFLLLLFTSFLSPLLALGSFPIVVFVFTVFFPSMWGTLTGVRTTRNWPSPSSLLSVSRPWPWVWMMLEFTFPWSRPWPWIWMLPASTLPWSRPWPWMWVMLASTFLWYRPRPGPRIIPPPLAGGTSAPSCVSLRWPWIWTRRPCHTILSFDVGFVFPLSVGRHW